MALGAVIPVAGFVSARIAMQSVNLRQEYMAVVPYRGDMDMDRDG